MKFKIGEASRLLGVSTQAIRAYEQAGILTSHRSENGTRYFEKWQLIRLISFKKYRAMDFSIAQIVDHFHDDTLAKFSGELGGQADALRARAEALLRTADAVDAHRRAIDAMPYTFEISKRPACYRFDDFVGCLFEHRHVATLQKWLDALPAMAISPLVPAHAPDAEPSWGLSISPEDAVRWSVDTDLPGVRHIPEHRCARMNVVFHSGRAFYDALEPALEQIRAAGHALDPAQEIWGRQLASETTGERIRLHYLFWFPLLPIY